MWRCHGATIRSLILSFGAEMGAPARVQVSRTGRLHRRGYEAQPVHSTRRGGKKSYSKKDMDVIAAHVQLAEAWYLMPIERVGRAKSLRLYRGWRGAKLSRNPLGSFRRSGRLGQLKMSRRRPREWEQ